MSAWSQQSNGIYPGMLDGLSNSNPMDPSMMSMYNGNAAFNASQFSNPGLQQRMSNGSVNPQDAYSNPTYNVASVIPSKRSRPGEEGNMAISPRAQQNNGLGVSRSQTPMQPNPYQSQQAQQYQAPNPYQHLQHTGSNNATPSPTMQNQPFRQPQPPQRISTASPAMYNQMSQGMSQQMSPAPSQPKNTSMSPQAQGQTFSPNLNGGQGFGQNFGQQGAMTGAMPGGGAMQGQGLNMASNPQLHAQLQQRQYQQRLLQQQQRMQASNMAQQRTMSTQAMGAQGNPMYNPATQQGGQNMPNGQPQSQNSAMTREKQDAFIKGLASHLQARGKPLNPQPTISGRPISIYLIWMYMLSAGGAQRINQQNMWPALASKLGFPNNPGAIQDIRQVYELYLNSYEQIYLHAKMQQRQAQAQMQARQMAGLGAPQQGSPVRQMSAGQDSLQSQFMQSQNQQLGQQQQQQQQTPSQTPVQQANQLQRNDTFSSSNGTPLPPMTVPAIQQQSDLIQHRRASSLKKNELKSLEQQTPPSPVEDKAQGVSAVAPPAVKREASSVSVKPVVPESTEYEPLQRSLDSYGGYDILSLSKLGLDLSRFVPDVPAVPEMGVIDIRALTLSLQSGINSEVRHALDSLVLLTVNPSIMLELDKCEDLANVLVESAVDQVDVLSAEAVEVSDVLDLTSYEDIVRLSRIESDSLQDIPAVGSSAYNLERAADRLIALTTILRNLSFNEANHRFLSDAPVITMLSNAIRLLGTRNMLLRNFANTADFYKDVVTFLSNIAGDLALPTRDDALHILHFILAFAPQPLPTITPGSPIRFYQYVPSLHRYLPLAVDTLAKLLARQDPNRAYYRSFFIPSTSSQSSSEDLTPSELLSRAFALSICVLPDRSKGTLPTALELRTVEVRKALLTQGMLAADILASLAQPPNPNDPTSVNLPRLWLESEDRWAASLLRMAYVLSTRDPGAGPSQQRQQATRIGPDGRVQIVESDTGYSLITHRGLGMIKKLVDKAGVDGKLNGQANGNPANKDDDVHDVHDDVSWTLKGDPIPHRETVLGALLMQNADKEALRLLCGLYETLVA